MQTGDHQGAEAGNDGATEAGFQRALTAWRDLLGDDRVVTGRVVLDRYGRTTGGGDPTSSSVALLPDHAEEVKGTVAIASQFGLGVYPISRGRNFGYGDACAPTDGQAIVDLSRMNRIIEVNRELAYAVVEPGVTQGQLWEHLDRHCPELSMDATGAGLEASILGNAVDRGFGHSRYGDHVQSSFNVEVVLADGRVLETGFGHLPGAKARWVYPYGMGPLLQGLFFQSNMGIVTKIGVWLLPKPQASCAFFVSARGEGDIVELIDRLAPLRRQGLLPSAIHVANDVRALSGRGRYPWERTDGRTPLPRDIRRQLGEESGIGAWNAFGMIEGTAGMVRQIRKAVARAMGPFRLIFISDRRIRMLRRIEGLGGNARWARGLRAKLDLVEPPYQLLLGKPTDEFMQGVLWRVRDPIEAPATDPIACHAGIKWVSPVLPMTGASALEVARIIEPIYNRHGFDALMTFTMLNERAMVCVSNLAFDRRVHAEREQAEACYHELNDRLEAAGYFPYRVGSMDMQRWTERPSVFWEVVRQIKNALDPQHIISPGRYCPLPPDGAPGRKPPDGD